MLDIGPYEEREEPSKMKGMREATVIALPAGIRRERRLPGVIEASRRLTAARGRAWINGREVGGTDKRFAHLSRSHD
jgi:hypothetical protein